MTINVRKEQFLSYLQKLGEKTNNSKYLEVTDTSFNIFDFKNEFNTFLKEEYNNSSLPDFLKTVDSLSSFNINNNKIITDEELDDFDNEIRNTNNQSNFFRRRNFQKQTSAVNYTNPIIKQCDFEQNFQSLPFGDITSRTQKGLGSNNNQNMQKPSTFKNSPGSPMSSFFNTGKQNLQSCSNNSVDSLNCTSSQLQNNVIPFRGTNSNSQHSERLNQLIDKRNSVSNDLSCNQNTFNSTQNEKNNCLDSINNEIKTGESNLNNSIQAVNDCQSTVDTATQEVDTATNNLEQSQQHVDNSQQDVESATESENAASNTAEQKGADNQQSVQNESNAQNDVDSANNDLTTATNNTENAQKDATDKENDLNKAVGESNNAYSVLNQANAEVAAAQSEYNAAQAESNDVQAETTSGEESTWNKVKNAVSSALNKLKNAITKRDEAQAEAEQKEAEKEKAEVASSEAQEKLQARKNEQAQAQSVADSAQVVLDKAKNEREVSDQEYADALITLATAMDERANAEDTYNSALSTYMEMKNYKADADGNLVDAEGNLVSAQQVVEEMETYIQGLSQEKEEEENSYNDILNTLSGVIEGDQTEIKNLDNEIKEVEKEIQEEEKLIALQEQMLQDLAVEKSEYNAQEETDSILDDVAEVFGKGSAKDKEAIETKQEALEKALLSGSPEDVANAYKEIYGDKEIVVNKNGDVVDVNSLSEEEQATCTVKTISELDTKNINSLMSTDAENIQNAKNYVNAIENGVIQYNGETLKLDDITNIISSQAQDLVQEVNDAKDQQGIISKLVGGINSVLGIGTTAENASAQAAMLQNLSENLKDCETAEEYATTFKAITGKDFDINQICQLLSYKQINTGTTAENLTDTSTENQVDITNIVNTLTNNLNENNIEKRDLSLFNDTEARETLEDYKETQDTLKDTAIGVVTAVVSATAIALAPVTGGASLALGTLVGAGTGLGLNFADSVYDSDNDGTLEINYSIKEAVKDTVSGAINGLFGAFGNALGGKVTKIVGSKLVNTASSALKQTGIKLLSKATGNAVEGAVDGGFSAGAEYLLEVATNKNVDFSLKEFGKQIGQGATFGSVLNVGMGALTDGVNYLKGTQDIDVPMLTAGDDMPVVAEYEDGVLVKVNDELAVKNTYSTDGAIDVDYELVDNALGDSLSNAKAVGTSSVDDVVNVNDFSVGTSSVDDVVNVDDFSGFSDDVVAKFKDLSQRDLDKLANLNSTQNKILNEVLSENGNLSTSRAISYAKSLTADTIDLYNMLKESNVPSTQALSDVVFMQKSSVSMAKKLVNDGVSAKEAIERINKSFDYDNYERFEDTYKKLTDIGFDADSASSLAVVLNEDTIEGFLTKYSKLSEAGINPSNNDILNILNLDINQTNQYIELLKRNVDPTGAFVLSRYPNSPGSLKVELSLIKNDPSYQIVEGGYLDRIGKNSIDGIKICSVEDISENFADINLAKYGKRLDTTLENWSIKIGDTNVKIRTDNNFVSMEKFKKGDVDLSNVVLLSKSQQKAIEDALQRMSDMGQELPEEIYLTDLFSPDARLGGIRAAGYYSDLNPNAIFVRSDQLNYSIEYAKKLIYHETAHMSDYKLGSNNQYLSSQVNSNINKTDEFIGTAKNTVKSSDVKQIISSYALTNEKEYIAEITALITEGTIYIDKNGKYAIKTDAFGTYIKAKGFLVSNVQKSLNDIMGLYMELTQGKIAIPKRIG